MPRTLSTRVEDLLGALADSTVTPTGPHASFLDRYQITTTGSPAAIVLSALSRNDITVSLRDYAGKDTSRIRAAARQLITLFTHGAIPATTAARCAAQPQEVICHMVLDEATDLNHHLAYAHELVVQQRVNALLTRWAPPAQIASATGSAPFALRLDGPAAASAVDVPIEITTYPKVPRTRRLWVRMDLTDISAALGDNWYLRQWLRRHPDKVDGIDTDDLLRLGSDTTVDLADPVQAPAPTITLFYVGSDPEDARHSRDPYLSPREADEACDADPSYNVYEWVLPVPALHPDTQPVTFRP